MSARASIRHYLVGTLLGAAIVALPAAALHVLDLGGPSAVAAEMPARSNPPAAALPNFAGLVQKYGPAVVAIHVTEKAPNSPEEQYRRYHNSPFGPFAPFFFGVPPNQQPQPEKVEGSGFIISSDGVILTNAHVVADEQHVSVFLKDRREFTAKVIGSDKKSDIAVLKIDAHDLPTVKIGDPHKLQVGQWVVAIGAPFGLNNTVTAGIVSAKGRTLPDGGYVPFIQTDVAVNPGNSGGPLFNMQGEVVGINSQIFSRTGGYMGLSFAIPIDVATRVAHQLRTTGHVQRGKLGIAIQDLTQQLAQSFGLSEPNGALIASVQPNSPAAHAGLKAGDVILAMNGKSVDTSSQLPVRVAMTMPGTVVTLKIWRNGSAHQMKVKLGEMGNKGVETAQTNRPTTGDRLGLSVRSLTPDEQQQLGVNGGVFVEHSSGPAERAGIRRGDVVLSANGAPVSNAAELDSIVQHSRHPVALLVQRGNARIFVPVQIR